MTSPASATPRVVLTYGRFDHFGQNHISFLRQLAVRGAEVIVGCATDYHAASLGLSCTHPFEMRRAVLQSCRYVSRVIPEESTEQKRTDIVNYNAHTLAMGSEWIGHYDDLQDVAKILYMKRNAIRGKSFEFSQIPQFAAAL